ncbi:GntR family transcriptional regulator [Candidatus Contubernalis alkaliaceticus]|uniref:GntR family transcriptional regulator n=1 Tax=Candidatus Contubernalis alkaliaceticus TaxID=338645 RepID=UPI001F4C2244|nr:GntR family transcriptional regulator [Candidatus Contubernalis alkalaceticus]UNC91350.1 GntR family transcriptional regulator [Candidatus Contubernalis alkalaceticus]
MRKTPVYVQIAEKIKNKINTGQLETGDAIDSENEICREFNVSRMTVRKSLAILINEGYIYSIPGKGNYVKKPEFSKYVVQYDEMKNSINSVDRTKLLEVNIVKPDDKLADKLRISKNKNVIMIRRIFYTEGEPVAYDIKFLVYYRGMPIVEKEIQYATFPEMVSKKTPLFSMKKEILISVEAADEEKKRYLNIYNDVPLLVVEQKFTDQENKPLGVGITYFRGDYIKLWGESL